MMMSKKVLKGLFIFKCLSITSYGISYSATNKCDQKIAEINKQLSFAKNVNNINEVTRLETALERVKANCTEASISRHDDKKISKLKRKLSEKEGDLIEHQQELEDAKKHKRTDKIEKYSRKIQKDQNKIDRLKKELSEYQGYN